MMADQTRLTLIVDAWRIATSASSLGACVAQFGDLIRPVAGYTSISLWRLSRDVTSMQLAATSARTGMTAARRDISGQALSQLRAMNEPIERKAWFSSLVVLYCAMSARVGGIRTMLARRRPAGRSTHATHRSTIRAD